MTKEPKPTRNQAVLALADLLPSGATTIDAKGKPTPQPLSALIRPLWEPVRLTIFHQETLCLHCGTTYRSASPRITLTEQHIRRPDKLRHTSSPPEGDIPANLPLAIEVIHEPSIPYCVSCVGGLSHQEVLSFLRHQAQADSQRSANFRRDKQALASARLSRTTDRIEDEVELTPPPVGNPPATLVEDGSGDDPFSILDDLGI